MKLSVITINFNNADGLKATVDSAASQLHKKDWEYIVIDGASTDGSCSVIQEGSGFPNKYVSEKDNGIYDAMNKGVRMAEGEYCLFMNSGDTFHNADVIGNLLDKLNGVDIIIGKDMYSNTGLTTDNSVPLSFNRFYLGSIPHQASIIKRNLLIETPYDENYRIVSDWKFFIQKLILENVSYKFIDDIICNYDCEGVSSTNKLLGNKERNSVLEDLFPPRILIDYQHFNHGSGYQDTDYDKFFIRLRDFKYGRIIYIIDVLIVRVLGIFKRSARFAKEYKIKF